MINALDFFPDLMPWLDNESDLYEELPIEDVSYDE